LGNLYPLSAWDLAIRSGKLWVEVLGVAAIIVALE
jgi:hypothetical protein